MLSALKKSKIKNYLKSGENGLNPVMHNLPKWSDTL